MESLYQKNGLIFWTEEEIKLRQHLADYFVVELTRELKEINRGFEIIQCEAPLLTPRQFINNEYPNDDRYQVMESEIPLDDGNDLILRPETTGGSYLYIQHLLNKHNDRKVKLPVVVWQHGKSFRKEDDTPSKFMRLKEFYQLEFQIAYSSTTLNDYGDALHEPVCSIISSMIGECRLEESDRLPSYSTSTIDVVYEKNDMEVCSMSKRTDLEDMNVFEIAIGTDRCVYNFLNKI